MRLTFLIISSILVIVAVIGAGSVLWAEAPTSVFVAAKHTPQTLTVGWVGDMVPSDDDTYNENVFLSTTPELEKPDLMIGNLEGTFALPDRITKCIYIASMCHAFAGDPSFAYALRAAGFDFVSLVNNHSYDFGKDGLEDTEHILMDAGIPFISPTSPTTTIVVKGKRVGILGLSSTEPTSTITDYAFIQKQVEKLKSENDFVIVIFHGGAEGEDKTVVPGMNEYMGSEDRGNVELVAHTAIEAGADLVLGSGPHVLRKIESYKNVPIAYSLGNFVGGKHLSMNGILATSGIFTAKLEREHRTTFDFSSILLSRDGIPSLDFTNQGKHLIESLSER